MASGLTRVARAPSEYQHEWPFPDRPRDFREVAKNCESLSIGSERTQSRCSYRGCYEPGLLAPEFHPIPFSSRFPFCEVRGAALCRGCAIHISRPQVRFVSEGFAPTSMLGTKIGEALRQVAIGSEILSALSWQWSAAC